MNLFVKVVWVIVVAFLFVRITQHLPDKSRFTQEQEKRSLNLLTEKTKKGCVFPIRYKIGKVDPRFELTEVKLQEVAIQAEGMWEEKIGKDLFRFDKQAGLAINLVYDERQVLMDRVKRFRAKANSLVAIRSDMDGFSKDLENLVGTFDREVLEYAIDSMTLSADGLTTEETHLLDTYHKELKRVEQLIEENLAFLRQLDAVEVRESTFLANLGDSLRDAVKKEGYVQGSHFSSHQGERIEIYMFLGEEDLRSTIAHELGHSIGLDHTEVPGALMNEIGGTHITIADLNFFYSECR